MPRQGEGWSLGHVRLPRHQKPQTSRANERGKLRTPQALRRGAPLPAQELLFQQLRLQPPRPAERCPAAVWAGASSGCPRGLPRCCPRSCCRCCCCRPPPCHRAWQVSRARPGERPRARRPRARAEPAAAPCAPAEPWVRQSLLAAVSGLGGGGGAPRNAPLRGDWLGSLQPHCGSGTTLEKGMACSCELESVGHNSWQTDRFAPARLSACGASAGPRKASQRTSKYIYSHHREVWFWAVFTLPLTVND